MEIAERAISGENIKDIEDFNALEFKRMGHFLMIIIVMCNGNRTSDAEKMKKNMLSRRSL